MIKNHIIIPYVFRCKQFIWMGNASKFPVNGFKWVKKLSTPDERFMKNYDGNSDKGYFFEVDVEYPKKLFNRVALNLDIDLPFLPERNKI